MSFELLFLPRVHGGPNVTSLMSLYLGRAGTMTGLGTKTEGVRIAAISTTASFPSRSTYDTARSPGQDGHGVGTPKPQGSSCAAPHGGPVPRYLTHSELSTDVWLLGNSSTARRFVCTSTSPWHREVPEPPRSKLNTSRQSMGVHSVWISRYCPWQHERHINITKSTVRGRSPRCVLGLGEKV